MVRVAPGVSLGLPAQRPGYTPLGTERGQLLPPLENAIARYAAVMAEAEFAGEAEAMVDGGTPRDPVVSSGARVS